MDAQQKRIKILSEAEIANFYGLPTLSSEEQLEHFSLSPHETLLLDSLGAVKSRVTFVLQLGYFKARRQFFNFDLDTVCQDAAFVCERYFPSVDLVDLEVSKGTRLKQRQLILELYNYRLCYRAEREALNAKARSFAKISGKPAYLLRRLVDYLAEQRIVVPGYTSLQDVVGNATSFEQERLVTILQTNLSKADTELLNTLLDNSQGLHEITHLKRPPKGLALSDIREEVGRKEALDELYALTQTLLPKLAISNESVGYYASLVGYYTVYKLKRLKRWTAYVYLLCFVHHRYATLHDNLVQSLLHHVKRFNDAAKEGAKERVYNHRLESNRGLQRAAEVLKLFTNTEIPDDTLFGKVKARAFKLLPPQKLDLVATHMATKAGFDETEFEWEHLDELASSFKRHLRPAVTALDFAAVSAHDPVLQMTRLLKTAFARNKPLGQYPAATFPSHHLGKKTRRYLYGRTSSERPVADRYEYLTYRLLRNGLEAGDIYCSNSFRFRSFEDDLVSPELWRDKDRLLADIGLPLLEQPIAEQLSTLKKSLEEHLERVNQRILKGENEHFSFKRQGQQTHWSLSYEAKQDGFNHPFYDQLKQTDIGRVLHYTDAQCPFMHVFDHVLGRYTKTEGRYHALTACLIAWGTNLGLGKMSEISDVSYPALRATSDNFIRLETLQAANDLVSNAAAALPMFANFNLDDVIHSSSDGQKFETQRDTFNARHSPKYFGLGKGVVAYSLVANYIPINARIIGANEHESHYVFDLLFNNTTEVQPEVHSTDTHGTNEVNFALLHLFGYRFAPRYKDLQGKVSSSLYGFRQPSQYTDAPLKPIRKINEDLIVGEWDNVLRIAASLALKTTTQHVIVRKLSAYARKNRTKRALWEYDNIIRSLYLLDYVDSAPLRRNVHTALNRGENYHQLRRAVSFANFGRLRFKTEVEQNLWSESSRLITNCLIYYNASLLSKVLEVREKADDAAGVAALKGVSPVAWQHINFAGRYEFGGVLEGIDLDAVVRELL